jgi:outer membrane lipoprotein-sorting protein
MRLLLYSCVLLSACGPAFGSDSLQAVYERMDKTASTFKGLTANVEKVSHAAIINDDLRDTGTIAVREAKPHNFQYLMKLNPPDGEEIELDNGRLQIYHPKTNTVETDDLGKQYKPLMEQLLLLGFGSNSRDLQSGYTVTLGGPETVAGQAATRLSLVPKSEQVLHQFPRIEIWISDSLGVAVQQKYYQPGGDYLMATFNNIKLDNVAPQAVRLNLPKNVQKTHLSH